MTGEYSEQDGVEGITNLKLRIKQLESELAVFCSLRLPEDDVTNQREVTQSVAGRYALADIMLENSLAMMFIKGKDRKYIEVNKAYADLFGVTRDAMIGRTVHDFLPSSAAASNDKEDDHIYSSGKPSYRVQMIPYNSELRYFETAKFPLFGDSGEVAAICFFGVETTDKQRAFDELREQTERLKGFLENAQSVMHIMDTESRFVLVNKRAVELWGKSAEILIGTTYSDLYDTEAAQQLVAHNERVMQSGKPEAVEYDVMINDQHHCVDVHKFPITDERGRVTSIGTIAKDVTTLRHAEVILKEHVHAIEEQVDARTRALRSEIEERCAVETALQENVERFQALFELAPDAVYLQTEGGRILDCNMAAQSMSGYSRSELVTMNARRLLPEGNGVVLPNCQDGECEKANRVFESTNIRKNGEVYPVEVQSRPLMLHGEIAQMVVVRDISDRKAAERQLKLFESVFESAMEGITITDTNGTILAVNEAFSVITGYSAAEVLGKNPRILKSDQHDKGFYREMWRHLMREGKWEGEIWNRKKSGEAYPEWLSISAIYDVYGVVANYVAVFHDISEMKEKEQLIQHQAYHDALTGLPNRLLLKDRIAVAAAHAERVSEKVAVLFIDLDNFKNINDSLGHAIGDQFLKRVARELQSLMRPGDTIARLGGDEFVIVLENVRDEADVIHMTERLVHHFDKLISVSGYDLFITMSIGIAFYPHDGLDPDTLIKNADLAMYQAKEFGKNQVRLFTERLNEKVQIRLKLESDMRKGIQDGDFLVYYQPKVDILTGQFTGMEALIRWKKADGEIVSPGNFLAVAEETGLIMQLGEFVLREACLFTKRLVLQGFTHLRCSVNISPRQFQQYNLISSIEDILRETGLDPANLEVEITETMLVKDIPQTTHKLRQLAEKGITIAIDDFGSGYSSLYYLKHFPIHILKIDRSFITDVPDDANDAAIVSTIIAMAEHMHMKVIAEGVEQESQLSFLLLQGCDEVQGYLFGKPMPEDVFREHISVPPKIRL